MKRWVYPIILALSSAFLGRFLLYGTPNPHVVQFLVYVLVGLSAYAWFVYRLWGGVFIAAHNLVYIFSVWIYSDNRLYLTILIFLAGYSFVAYRLKRRYIQRCLHYEQSMTLMNEQSTEKELLYRQAESVRKALGRKYNRYHELQSIAEALTSLNDVQSVANLVVKRVFQLIGKSDACYLKLLSSETHELELAAVLPNDEDYVQPSNINDQFEHYVLKHQRPLLIEDVKKDFRFSFAGGRLSRVRSVMACPIVPGQSVAGVLLLESSQPDSYGQDDLRLLDILMDLSGVALTNAQLFERTQHLATTDGLTELMLRRPFMEELNEAIYRSEKSGDSFALLMLDVDHFKKYNDTFGHMAGDLILKTLGTIIEESIPENALAARFGGEEFSVIVPNVDHEKVLQLAENLRRNIESKFKEGRGRLKRKVTVSIGVALYPKQGHSDLELIRSADQQLYAAKHAGRNRVCMPS